MFIKSISKHTRSASELNKDSVKPAREYIAQYWQKLERFNPENNGSLIGLPNPYLVPSHDESAEFDFDEMYYWDSYFMVQGMLDKEHEKLVTGILENQLYLFERFNEIPNATRTYLTGRSQPPLLTSFIFDVYRTYNKDLSWLQKAINTAKHEYKTVWMGAKKPNARLVWHGLSRYYDINHLHDLAEAESGWDMTPRFGRKALNYLPVDLNSLLYKYELDFANAARSLNDTPEAELWEKAADTRRASMNKLMWDKRRGLYFDYNFVTKKRGGTISLASYYPMWAGLVDKHQAASLVRQLRRFENKGGLATTDTLGVTQQLPNAVPVQWAYPNGWAPLHYIVVEGLRKYGYDEDARRIALKWLRNNLDWFNTHGVFLEKYNVVNPTKEPREGLYPSQTGFGWTNAVFERFCQMYIDQG